MVIGVKEDFAILLVVVTCQHWPSLSVHTVWETRRTVTLTCCMHVFVSRLNSRSGPENRRKYDDIFAKWVAEVVAVPLTNPKIYVTSHRPIKASFSYDNGPRVQDRP